MVTKFVVEYLLFEWAFLHHNIIDAFLNNLDLLSKGYSTNLDQIKQDNPKLHLPIASTAIMVREIHSVEEFEQVHE